MPTKPKTSIVTSIVPSEDAIRQQAYLLWEADGRPDGMAEHYWLKALDVPPAANKAKAAKVATAKAVPANKAAKKA